jgi:hypothetical protein
MQHRPVLAALAASLVGLATVEAQTPIRVGPVVGVNIATFGGEDAGDVGSRTAFFLGGFAAFQLSQRFILEPSLLYTQKGGHVDFEDEDTEGTIKLSYIQIPLLGRLRFPSGGIAPNLVFGPALAFRTGCTASGSQGPVEINIDCDEADFQLASTDFSLIIGAGIEVNPFMFSVRYDYGISAVPGEGSDDVFNRVWSIVAQYGFRVR